jgi:hypothetical protein
MYRSKKLAVTMFKAFSNVNNEKFGDAYPHQILKIMNKYANHGWMFSTTYNALINAFAKHFEVFSTKDLTTFCTGLSTAGLR